MEHKKVYGIPLVYIITLVYVIFTTVLGMMMNHGLILFLGWNVLLATCVYAFAQLFVMTRKSDHPSWVGYLVYVLFVLFFPNTFYILTDTIHFQAYSFFIDYPSMYAFVMDDWLVFSVITLGLLYGLKLGIHSIDLMYDVQYPLFKKHPYLYLLGLFTLSSVGVYLGRFIRLNSWNIFAIERMIFGIFDHIGFFIQFVFIFTIVQYFSYFLFSSKTKILYNHTKESEE